MSAAAKEALREAIAAFPCDGLVGVDCRTCAILASLDSLVVLTAEEAEKVRRAIGMPAMAKTQLSGAWKAEALALLSGSGRADSEENE